MENYTEKEHSEIATASYKDFKVGDVYQTNEGLDVGKVTEVIHHQDTGLDAYVVEGYKGEIDIIYRGSELTKQDWRDNNLPMGIDIILSKGHKDGDGMSGTPQLRAGAELANRVAKQYPDKKINLYGHSLGGMVTQQACASFENQDQLGEAFIFQSPNIYGALTKKEQESVDKIRYKIQNFIDPQDVVPIGYDKSVRKEKRREIGIVHYADTKRPGTSQSTKDIIPAQILGRHSMKYYQWNADGSLKKLNPQSAQSSLYGDAIARVGLVGVNFEVARKRMSEGKLTKGDKILLDSEQAIQQADLLNHKVESAGQAIRETSQKYRKLAKEMHDSLSKVPFGYTISPEEVRGAYDEAGLNYETIVGRMEQKVAEVLSKSKKIQDRVNDLNQEMGDKIMKTLEEDGQLAKEFRIGK